MLRKAFSIAVVTAAVLLYVSGCKKSPDEGGPEPSAKAPTVEDYRAEAEKEITKENMAEELERLEKEIEQEISQERQP
jgi:uncharacterized protein (UPF0254 family)